MACDRHEKPERKCYWWMDSAGGRPLLIPMLALPWEWRLVAILPAFFLATLFFLDQHITVRTVNSPAN